MVPTETREEAVLGKIDLMKRGGPSVAVQGGLGPSYREEAPKQDPRFEHDPR
jgi:hypothetical protein